MLIKKIKITFLYDANIIMGRFDNVNTIENKKTIEKSAYKTKAALPADFSK